MKTVIPESLVSIYDITVPYVLDVRKLRRRLDAELEKLHPRFPDRCVADYRLRFQHAGNEAPGIHIRAVVMDRFELAAIRKKKSGCTLYAGGLHPYPVFSRSVWEKRIVLAGSFLVLLAVAVLVRVTLLKKPDVVMLPDAGAVMEVLPDEALQNFDGQDVSSGAEAVFDFSPFLNGIYEQDGSVSVLSWNTEERMLRVQVSGLFPEQVTALVPPEMQSDAASGKASFGPVSYSNGIPLVQVSLHAGPDQVTLQGLRLETEGQPPCVDGRGVSSFRQLILETGGQLLSETVSPPSLSGSVPVSEWAAFAPALLALSDGVPVSHLELVRNDGAVAIELTLSENGTCLPFSDLAAVFGDAPGLPYEPEPEDEWAAALAEKREIGRISRGDGTSVVFFHNADGQIERRVYEN